MPAWYRSSRTSSSRRSSRPTSISVGGRLRDPRHLLERLARLRRAVDPDHAARPLLRGEAGRHPRLGRSRHRADDHGVEEDAELLLLLGHLLRPARVAEAAQRVVGRAGRDRVWLAAARLDVGERLLPALLEADAESRSRGPRQQLLLVPWPETMTCRRRRRRQLGLNDPHLGAEDPRQEDVPDAVVDDVRPVDPALLDEHAGESCAGGGGGHLPCVVRLHAADRDERVAALRQRVRDQVLQLARLVPAEGEARGDVVALGPERGAAEVLGQALERMDGRRPEQQLIALEAVERRGHGLRGTRRTSPLCR